MAMAAGVCTALQYIGMSERCAGLGFRPYDCALSCGSALLVLVTGELSCPRACGHHFWVLTMLCTLWGLSAPVRAEPFLDGGLRWQLEPASPPSSTLVWVEDTEVWADLPRQIPLVLLEPDSLQTTTSSLPWQ